MNPPKRLPLGLQKEFEDMLHKELKKPIVFDDKELTYKPRRGEIFL